MKESLMPASAGCLCAMVAAGFAGAPGGNIVAHRGWSGCVELKNPACRVVVVPAVGARVAVFEHAGVNVLLEDPELDGKVLAAGENWMKWDGSQPDTLTPENGNQLEHVWMGQYEVAHADALRLVCKSAENKSAGLRQEKEFILDPEKPVMTVKRRLFNVSGKPARWAFWDRTLCPAGAVGVAPVNPGSAYAPALWGELKEKKFAPGTPGAGNPAVTDGVFIAWTKGKGVMVGMDAWEGWTGAFVKGLFFGITYPAVEGKEYPRGPGVNNSFWFTDDALEVEPVSWFFDIEPGGAAEWVVTWSLTPVADMPSDAAGIAALAKALAPPLVVSP